MKVYQVSDDLWYAAETPEEALSLAKADGCDTDAQASEVPAEKLKGMKFHGEDTDRRCSFLEELHRRIGAGDGPGEFACDY